MSALDDLQNVLDALDTDGRRRQLRTVAGLAGRLLRLDGREVINFSSNNYLGLAGHPALCDASVAAVQRSGTGSTASRLIAGNLDVHTALERALAEFHEQPGARLFNSGYHANLGVLPTLAEADDIIFSDELNHASIIDGCRLSRARVQVYAHSDMDALQRAMRDHAGRRRFVVTDTLFSMDGDLARLHDIADLCAAHGAALVVDEAHALGVLGPKGRGLGALMHVTPDVHVGTLGKAFGSFGAYVTGSEAVVEVLLNRARSFVFTTALPPAVVAASHAALVLIAGQEGEARRNRLAELVAGFRDQLAARDLLVPGAGDSAIFPVMVGDDRRVMACTEYLLARGIYVQGIRPPTVAAGTARLRFTLMATHTRDDVARAVAVLDELVDKGLVSRLGREDAR